MRLKDKPLAIFYLDKLFTESMEFQKRIDDARRTLESEFPFMFRPLPSKGHRLQYWYPISNLAPKVQNHVKDVTDATEVDNDDYVCSPLGKEKEFKERTLELAQELSKRFVFGLSKSQEKHLIALLINLLCDFRGLPRSPRSVKMHYAYDTEAEEIVIRIKAPVQEQEMEEYLTAITRLQESFCENMGTETNWIAGLETEQKIHERKLKLGGKKTQHQRHEFESLRSKRWREPLSNNEEKQFQELRSIFQNQNIFKSIKNKKKPAWPFDDQLELQRVFAEFKNLNQREFDVFRKRRLAVLLRNHGVKLNETDVNNLGLAYGNLSAAVGWKTLKLTDHENKYLDWLRGLPLLQGKRQNADSWPENMHLA